MLVCVCVFVCVCVCDSFIATTVFALETQKSSTSAHVADEKNAEPDANASDSEGMS